MVWSQNSLAQALARYRAEKDRARSAADPLLPGQTYSLPKRNFSPPNEAEVAQKRRANFTERLGNINQAYDFEGPSGDPSDYLERAEDIMFQANKIRQKTEKKLSNPIVKEKPFTYNVDVPMNVPQYYPVNKKGKYTDPAIKAQVGMGMNSMTAAEVKAQEAAILAGKKPKRAGNRPTPSGNFGAFVNAISGQESGGNYGAVNSSSGAAGRYQIMPGNFTGPGGWDKETIGRDITLQEFMRNPAIQDAIARGKMKQYYTQFGPRGAAAAWYAGPDDAQNWMNTASQGAYPTIAAYVQSIMRRMGGR